MKYRLALAFLFFSLTTFAQDSLFARHIVDTLTSPYFWGRGYTNDGMHKAAGFISGQFKGYGLQPLDGKNFIQPFSFNANTFPGAMEVSVNGIALTPGKDFIIGPESRGLKASGKLLKSDSIHFVDPKNRVIITLQNKLTWSAEQGIADYTLIDMLKSVIHGPPSSFDINVENKLITGFQTGNICGMVRGVTKPDSFVVMTAHYDHLGGMGAKTYFPGANDNASGISQLLSLARYYAQHPQPYSMVFICFSGEEAGLLGSKFFSENPLIPLANIRFLVNMDILGTGEEGITVVNATTFPKEFAMLKQINDNAHYLVKVASRGKATNSDHYWFTEKGVPSFFIYTMGGIKAYHDVYDVSKTLPLNEYNHLFRLLVDFNSALMNSKPVYANKN
ncbi:MAG: M28 family peptidase [Bacteroidetes bacterium]|nr:M28 family peptidase [Bacteroidota bacterium]